MKTEKEETKNILTQLPNLKPTDSIVLLGNEFGNLADYIPTTNRIKRISGSNIAETMGLIVDVRDKYFILSEEVSESVVNLLSQRSGIEVINLKESYVYG